MSRIYGLSEKIDKLRSIETYGYQAAYYVLQDHQLAAEATKGALLALSQDEAFFSACHEVMRSKMRAQIGIASLAAKLESCVLRSQTASCG